MRIIALILLLLAMFNCAEKELAAMSNVYCIILAGGFGERLWPLSTRNKPKQLLSITDEKTLLDQAIDRIMPMVSKEHIWISTTVHHSELIANAVGNRVGRIVVEPSARNTGPAILLLCLELQKRDPLARVVFLPADSFIPQTDNELFLNYVEEALNFVEHHDCITVFGVRPTYPATGYGYIEFDAHENKKSPVPAISFHEKPSHDVAQYYLDSGSMLWNIGMFCGKVSIFINEFSAQAPRIYDHVHAFFNDKGTYEDVPSCSIDYAVIEKSDRIYVLPVDFSWCDVGNIGVFLSLKNNYAKLDTNVVTVNAHNNMVDVSDMLVALIGVDDLCVVQHGDVLLITKYDTAEQVKLVVEQLKQKKQDEYL